MQKEYEIVIADTSCLILLDKIGELQLLQLLFEKVTITEESLKNLDSNCLIGLPSAPLKK